MIDAREARIVYEENEYKNDIRDVLEAQKKAEEEAAAKLARVSKYAKCEELIQPIYDKIAEAAADGYNNIALYISDYSYKKVSWSQYKYWDTLNSRPVSASLTGYVNMPTQRHNLTHLIAEVLESHGYTTEITREYWGYNEYDELIISW